MKNNKYQQPAIRIVNIQQQHSILNTGGSSHSGPTAGWISDPGLSGSRSSREYDDGDE